MFKNNDLLFCRAAASATAVVAMVFAAQVQAFCGFYVGKADADLFNDASKVVMVRDGDRTTINMLNDYKGDLKEFALVVPVPEVLQKDQVKTPHRVLFDRIDAYSAPRLAEYFDRNPCAPRRAMAMMKKRMPQAAMAPSALAESRDDLGVTVEAQYTVGPYDIVILSATESDGLETWLQQNEYQIPSGASAALAPYIKQDMKFFVAKINLQEQEKAGSEFLAPLQFSFKSEKFMLPIRLGMINARGPQDLVLWVLTRNGRVEATNYRTVKLPANVNIPPYIKIDEKHTFGAFYKALFDEQAKREQNRVLFTEYFWDMAWCDPCASNPLTPQELSNLGVNWVTSAPRSRSRVRARRSAQPVRVTRLHVRYTAETFPEDLMFQETADRANFQTRYVLQHPVKVELDACPAAEKYLEQVHKRKHKEVRPGIFRRRMAGLQGMVVRQAIIQCCENEHNKSHHPTQPREFIVGAVARQTGVHGCTRLSDTVPRHVAFYWRIGARL
jgi:hypothetical protein